MVHDAGEVEFEVDALDRRRARAEARARMFPGAARVKLGRYELRARLGSGSWGVVYRAYDPLTARTVALKVVHRGIETSETSAWRREAQLLAKLRHPHIIEVYDVGIADGRAYFVTELLPRAQTLTRWLASHQPPLEVLVRGFADLAEALSAVHAQGVLHRDIKPDNILVDARGRFRLVDFGLAREAHDPSRDIEGTPAFMPSEVRRGGPCDVRSDAYGLCASLWFAVCGSPPPRGTPPKRLQHLLRVGLATDPANRFRGAEPLRAALQATLRPSTPWVHLGTTLALGIMAALAVMPSTPQASAHESRPRRHDAGTVDGTVAKARRLVDTERFDPAEHHLLEALRDTRDPHARARLQLALGRARIARGDGAEARHLLESTFFHASAFDLADLASDAALSRFEVAVDDADIQAMGAWQTESSVWLGRRTRSVASAELRQAIAESRSLALQGRTADALQRLPDPPGVDDPAIVIAYWFQRGELLNRRGRLDEGLEAFRAAADLAQTSLPPQHALLRSARWNLAATHSERGEFALAAKEFGEVLDAALALDTPPPRDIAELQRNLGAVYFELGDIERALEHTRTAVEASQAAYGPAHGRSLEALGNLAAILHLDGQIDAARATSWRALVTAEAEYGDRHPRLVSLLSNLAVIELTRDDIAQALDLLHRAEDILEASGDGATHEMAGLQTNLAHAYAAGGEPVEARSAARKALALYEATLGPAHPELAESLLQLIPLELAIERYDDARGHALRLRTLSEVDPRRRARAAFFLAQLDALRSPPVSPIPWLTIAANESEQSSEDPTSSFAMALQRWRDDWRAERAALLRRIAQGEQG